MRRTNYASMTDALDFVRAVKDDAGAYIEYTSDQNDRLEMVFWAYSDQLELALTIGDVIITDNTAQTNRLVEKF